MFKHIAGLSAAELTFSFEGHVLRARKGDTVASALLLASEQVTRNTSVSGSPRGPYCLMGVCFECLVEINGVPNRQACMTILEEGMAVRKQRGAAELQG
ncbi:MULTISPECIES: (2Fe-2S)-binding protein [Agrobacterium]|uniref:(2Fe-2S)-binding protein n=1 Tax=Agrobacterium TaxID=357 RepID=UPI001571A6C4|nr:MULTISPECIES: (2Fe-2S)-binding protein [Agrobacterium]NSX89031.1 (2Fe-2S)-binding protein [Agrobacterium tumefaciens]NSZ19687.1 (2Fe-2S)-binding protein [Agrobacterium vitis]QZO06914.1 (2Fe-2S)-binding protein [Agrobacterium vitis]UJL91456.1 (2Fe-2S)-binding protein [Agrobacterium vitis]